MAGQRSVSPIALQSLRFRRIETGPIVESMKQETDTGSAKRSKTKQEKWGALEQYLKMIPVVRLVPSTCGRDTIRRQMFCISISKGQATLLIAN